MLQTMTTPALMLAGWTFIMWGWLYATRIPALGKAGINASKISSKADLDPLPQQVKNVADNYNHLHEQPVLFYFLALYSQSFGVADPINASLAWGYVGIRIGHSIVQSTVNFVPLHFVLFVAGTVVLITIFIRNALALQAG